MADPQFAELLPKSSLRRRSCVICRRSSPNGYVTSFTKVPGRQEEWVRRLANGDKDFEDQLRTILATGRKYLCLDHFDRRDLVKRKDEEGMEIVRNSLPIPYKNTSFAPHDFTADEEFPSLEIESPEIPEKRGKQEFSLLGKGGEMDAKSISFLIDTVNRYVIRAMEDAR